MITHRLADFIAFTEKTAAPWQTKRLLCLSMLDWVACGIAGADEPVSRITRGLVEEEAGAKQAHVFGGHRVPVRAAALVNGTVSHALDFDDTHFAHIGHPSVAVIPAALALAEHHDVSGSVLQHAMLLGIETSIRVGIWLGRTHYQTGFHQTATAGTFGATAASARLLGLDASGTAAALGLAATRASGLQSQFGTMGKPFNAGIAAANGVEASLLIARGFEPNSSGIDTLQGFGDTHASERDVESALFELGKRWIFDGIHHKFHACCHGLHATLEAIANYDRPQLDDIVSVSVATHPRWLTVCNQSKPSTGLGAKFSFRLVVALALLGYDTASPETFRDELCFNPDVLTLRDRVAVAGCSGLSETQAQVEIAHKKNEMHKMFYDLDSPMSLSERETRIFAKAATLVGEERASKLWDIIKKQSDPSEIGLLIRASETRHKSH